MSVDYRQTMRATNEGAFAPGNDPNNWQFNYNYNQDPAGNQFSETETSGNTPIVTFNQGGNPSNRGIIVQGEDPPAYFNHIFQLSSAPQLNPAIGCTAEFQCAVVSQTGYNYQAAGVEFTYTNGAASLTISEDYVELSVPGAGVYKVSALDNSAQTVYRLTIDNLRVCRVYRGGSLIITSDVMPTQATNGLRFMFWGEGDV